MEHLLTVERFTVTVLFYYEWNKVFDSLVGREALVAAVALTTSPGDRTCCHQTRVDDTTIQLATVGTFHG